jgi:WhiB family redox-sensing transcriptional regulator
MTVHPDPDPGWRAQALCAVHPDPDLWFPDGESTRHAAQIKEAKRICRACPAVWQCATWALENKEPHGVWGALSESERPARIKRGYRLIRREAAA